MSVDKALDSVLSGNNTLISGPAGSGKSTFIKTLVDFFDGSMLLSAPTGLAALNIGGGTQHRMFGLGFDVFVEGQTIKKNLNKQMADIIKSNIICMLICDEISMLRSDKCQEIDYTLKKYKNNNKPFGGVQVIALGDVLQLSPVVKDSDRSLLSSHYDSPYFFDAPAYKEANFNHVKLETVYRQSDEQLKFHLENIRLGQVNKETIDFFNSMCYDSKPNQKNNDVDFVTLCPTNKSVDHINNYELAQLSGPTQSYKAVRNGKFNETPVPEHIELKVGARVMMCKNKEDGSYVNGTMGIVKKLGTRSIQVELSNSKVIFIQPETWYNVEQRLDKRSNKIKDFVVGEYTQLPLKLSWACTGHKSQGLTLEKGHLELGDYNVFGEGLLYVMLSRFRTLDNLSFSRPIRAGDIKVNQRVIDWYRS